MSRRTESHRQQIRQAREQGIYRHAARIEMLAEQIKACRVASDDDPPTANHKNEIALAATTEALGITKSVLNEAGSTTKLGVYEGPAPSLNGEPRVLVREKFDTYTVSLMPSIDPDSLVPGQMVEISANGQVVSAEPRIPQEGEIRTVTGVFANNGASGWIEIEEPERDCYQRLRLSGFVDAEQIRVDDTVRVKDGFVYERVEGHRKRGAFLDSMAYAPDGRVTFDDVKGQDEAMLSLRLLADKTCWPELYPGRILEGNVIKLLCGEPGNGKSTCAEALCYLLHESLGPDRFRSYLIPATAVKEKWVGSSEKNLRSLFDEAVRLHREQGVIVLIIFEEFDALGVSRGTWDTSGVSDSLVNTLISYLDGEVHLEGVIVLCLTNEISAIDPALLRSRRLGGSNTIRFDRLGSPAVREIVCSRLQKADLLNGSGFDPFVQAVDDALATTYGTAVVGKQKIPVKGIHLTSGAAASSSIDAGLEILHRHIFLGRQNNIQTPFNEFSPAVLYHGILKTLHAELHMRAGRRSLGRAREFFVSGQPLIHPDDADALSEVQVEPLGRIPVPERYDLSAMLELERG
jgi:hypothetical protein